MDKLLKLESSNNRAVVYIYIPQRIWQILSEKWSDTEENYSNLYTTLHYYNNAIKTDSNFASILKFMHLMQFALHNRIIFRNRSFLAGLFNNFHELCLWIVLQLARLRHDLSIICTPSCFGITHFFPTIIYFRQVVSFTLRRDSPLFRPSPNSLSCFFLRYLLSL